MTAQPSQCDRALAVLSDGERHTMREVHERAGFMRLNSRVSELRARGYYITCDREGSEYVYQLLGSLHEPNPQVADSPGDVEGDFDSASSTAASLGSWSDSPRSRGTPSVSSSDCASSSIGDRVVSREDDGPVSSQLFPTSDSPAWA